MNNLQKESFKRELRELLEKYNVSINWTCHEDSDLACVFDAHIEIIDIQGKPVLVFNDDYIDIHEIDDCKVIITPPKETYS